MSCCGHALILMLLRYEQELVDPEDYKLPSGKAGDYRISKQEKDMAAQLISSMTTQWRPGDYHDEFRARLSEVIRKRLQAKEGVRSPEPEHAEPPEDATTNVVDFMALLKQSLDSKKRTPPRHGRSTADKDEGSGPARTEGNTRRAARRTASSGGKAAVKSGAAKKTAAKKTAAKKAAAKKAAAKQTAKTAARKTPARKRSAGANGRKAA